MPLAQLKEPWPLMELVPLDPEVRGAGDRRRRPASPDPHRGGAGAARSVSAAPRGRECPSVSNPLSGSTPLCSGCAFAGDGSAGRSIPPCGSQEREPHGVLRSDP